MENCIVWQLYNNARQTSKEKETKRNFVQKLTGILQNKFMKGMCNYNNSQCVKQLKS